MSDRHIMYCMLSVYFWKGNSTYTALSFVSPALTPQKHQAFFPTQWSPLSFPFLTCLVFCFLSSPLPFLFFSFLSVSLISYSAFVVSFESLFPTYYTHWCQLPLASYDLDDLIISSAAYHRCI